MPYATVGPDVLTQPPGRSRALDDGAELRPADASAHPGRTHRTGSDAHLDDVSAGLDQIDHARGGDDVARHHRNGGVERTHDLERVEHAVLVAVRGVDDEHVDAGVEQSLRLESHVTADPDRRGDAESARSRRARARTACCAGHRRG